MPKADAQELAELSAAMDALEEDSEGDLEDDFLLTATEVGWMRCDACCNGMGFPTPQLYPIP